jgi:hypothetical protein
MKLIQFRPLDAGGKGVGDGGERLAVGAANRTVRIYTGPRGNPDRNFDRLGEPGVCDPSAPGGIRWSPALGRTGPESRVVSVVDLAGRGLSAARPANIRRDDARRSREAAARRGGEPRRANCNLATRQRGFFLTGAV